MRNKLDRTLDRVIELTLDIPNLTVADWKEIATQVTGMADRDAKDAKIRALAIALHEKTLKDALSHSHEETRSV